MVFSFAWPSVPSSTTLCYGLLGTVALAVFTHFLLVFLAKRRLNKMLSHIRGLSKDAKDGAISKTASVRKIHIIANPISGGGQGLQIAGAVADLAKAHRLPVKGAYCCNHNCEQL